MHFFPLKLFLALAAVVCSGCASTTDKFKQANPASVAVVIGYHITAKDSVHPAIRSGLALGLQMILPGTSVAASLGNIAAGTVTQVGISAIGVEKPATVTNAINNLVYQRVECSLAMKGYAPALKHTAPVDPNNWKEMDADEYMEYIASTYNFDEAGLAAFDEDIILYIEYTLSAYAEDADLPQPMELADLQLDLGVTRIYAVSKPPDNHTLFAKFGAHMPYFSRSAIDETVNNMIRFHDWPGKTAIKDEVNKKCRVKL